jgi:hypothetical protein
VVIASKTSSFGALIKILCECVAIQSPFNPDL